ncbi:MAG: DUF1176 domain-containing protein [Rhabdaerophilum sp.]
MGKSTMRAAGLMAIACFALVNPTQAQNAPAAQAPAKVDLKLFEKAEVDRSKGCSFVLWQEDRDPEKDRFAYVFSETLGRNHARENARVKIGLEVLSFRRVAVGGAKEFGYKTFPYALYKAEKDDSYLIFDLKLEDSPGEVMDVTGGTMTVIRSKLPPFVISVKGNAGCNTPAAAPAPAPRTAAPAPQQSANRQLITPPAMFEAYPVRGNQVPAKLRAEAVKTMGCKDANLRKGGTGYSMSEESAIWDLTCQDYTGGPGKIMVLVYTPDPAQNYTFLRFEVPKGKERQTHIREIVNPKWDLKTRTITSVVTEGNGRDCGIFERHQLNEEGQFELIEYREKTMCDGKSMEPREFPLVYRR